MSLKNAYQKVINKHFSAVQTVTLLGHTDDWRLEKKARQCWEDYGVAEKEFMTLLEKIDGEALT